MMSAFETLFLFLYLFDWDLWRFSVSGDLLGLGYVSRFKELDEPYLHNHHCYITCVTARCCWIWWFYFYTAHIYPCISLYLLDKFQYSHIEMILNYRSFTWGRYNLERTRAVFMFIHPSRKAREERFMTGSLTMSAVLEVFHKLYKTVHLIYFLWREEIVLGLNISLKNKRQRHVQCAHQATPEL